jgi:hypothetical protein
MSMPAPRCWPPTIREIPARWLLTLWRVNHALDRANRCRTSRRDREIRVFAHATGTMCDKAGRRMVPG